MPVRTLEIAEFGSKVVSALVSDELGKRWLAVDS